MEPHVKLAFAMRDTPGAYAVLLGAGVSMAAGLPSAWDVQVDLIERLAAAESTTTRGNAHAWYKQRFGHPATYDRLLDALTSTPYERQAMLRSYFEPDDQQREDGLKQPTAAHHAIARLVAAGHVRIVLTTNFDRLMETALREAGIEPTVVTNEDDAAGLAPLHTLKGVVVHLHGDYLDPTSMLNTPDELDHYAAATDALLDRVLAEYGLVISGWSARTDPALRKAFARTNNRFFASYWTDPAELSEAAQDLLTHRAVTYVETDADTFFTHTADAVDALTDTARQHPASIAASVAIAKRALSGTRPAVSLHDALHRETSRIADLRLHLDGDHAHSLATLEAETELLLALTATTAYWGNKDTDRWWLHDIEPLGTQPDRSGSTALLHLTKAPATMLIYTAGIAALAAERWSTLVRLLDGPTAFDPYGEKTYPAAALLTPWETIGLREKSSERLYTQLQPVFTQHLALTENTFRDAWERFEYLRLIVEHVAGRNLSWPHIRATEHGDVYAPASAAWVKKIIDAKSGPWSLGLLKDAAPESIDRATTAIDTSFHKEITRREFE
ncbi:SIR2 family protein [Streptomyces sp. NPDC005492]|uniref:SIR2 family protein n=1 Tax=Streptomyces sp. NPDC005492 TaxID=3156883 RepID=UPI0033AF38D5